MRGVRRRGSAHGRHALAALALGARAVFLGRLPVYALAVDGADGVRRLLDELDDELVETLRLAGCAPPPRAARDPGPLTLRRTPRAANDTDVVRSGPERPSRTALDTQNAPLTCANANVTGATPSPI